MKLDNVQLEIITNIQKGIKEKYNKDISIEEISSIVESQFKIFHLSALKNISIRLPFIGSFLVKDKLNPYIERFKETVEINNEAFLEEERNRKLQQILDYKKTEHQIAIEKTSTSEFLNSPTVINGKYKSVKFNNIIEVLNSPDKKE